MDITTQVIALIGSSGSGKTTLLEYLVSNLSMKGFQIGTAKHIHHGDFTIDTPGKDTWRHAQAGARTVIAVSTDEVAIIQKTKDLQEDLTSVLKLFDTKIDMIFLEGLHTLVLQRNDVYKIITASTVSDAKLRLSGVRPPILAVSGKVARRVTRIPGTPIPVLDVTRSGRELVKIVERIIV